MSAIRLLIAFDLAALACATVHAQHSYEKINANFGTLASVPMSPTSNYAGIGWGLVGGAGYNFSSHHSAIGEFMWSRLPATDGALQPLREASGINNLQGHSNLYIVTGNYRFEWQTHKFGAYFIGGAGLYYRTTNPSARVNSGSGTPCTPAWLWWGFSCTSGAVASNQLGSTGSNAFGGNGGVGFTVRVGEEPYRLYLESRYHYAPNKGISTQIVTITFGIRY
jgi:hypothetical protein